MVPFNQHVTQAVDGEGRPLRKYELIVTVSGDTAQMLATSLAQPIRYAHVGVSAADDKTHTLDDPKWTGGAWGGAQRFGNEGPVSAPFKIFVVKRDAPLPPPVPLDSERVFASPADYHSHSFYTYRWIPTANLKTHIFRALDDTLFQTDWERRATDSSNVDPNHTHLFPAEWDATKRAQVANELNHLNTFNHDADKAKAMVYYRGLSNDGLRALAGLPSSERAFTQITILPLDPNDPSNANRLGPDNTAGFAIDSSLRAYIDTLDGRSTNRYFYRAAYIDGAHNRSSLSLSSPPVWLPNVVPPRTPVITKVRGGDRQVTIKWASNREPDLVEYRIYRTESEHAARHLRQMTHIHSIAVTAAPETRPATIEWTDENVPALVPLYYRTVAVDDAGNVSAPTPSITVQAYDDSRPAPPLWEPPITTDEGVMLRWTLNDSTHRPLVQRRSQFAQSWTNLTSWLTAGSHEVLDKTREDGRTYLYRIRVRDEKENVNRDFSDLEV